MAALRGGAAVLGLLQQPVDEMCSHGHLQQIPAGTHGEALHLKRLTLHPNEKH